MKKSLSFLAFLILTVTLCLQLGACSGSNDDFDNPAETPRDPGESSAGLKFEPIKYDDLACTCVGMGTCTESDVFIDRYNGLYVKRIESYAFSYCSSLTSVTLGDSVTTICTHAFKMCPNLKTITIGAGVTSIGRVPIFMCDSLTSIEVSSDNTAYKSIDGNLYTRDGKTLIRYASGKTDTSFTIPTGVTTIADEAFSYCNTLTEVIIPDGVTTIGREAFYECERLMDITIPDSVTDIGFSALAKCTDLTNIKYRGSMEEWSLINKTQGWLSGSGITNGYTITYEKAEEPSEEHLESTAGLEFRLNADGKSYTCIGIGTCAESEIAIDYYNDLPVTSIRDYAFSNCSNLTSVTIPNSVTTIGGSAFYRCSSLTSVIIPNSVTTIGGSAFQGCESLASIEVSSDNTAYKSIDGNLYSKDGKTLIQYAIGKTDTTLIIPNSVTTIGDWAFADCSSLTSITIPDGVTTIRDHAFYSCSSLTSVTIPDSVTTIEHWAFADCSSLTSITIPDGVTTIEDKAFYDCSSLTSVTIPDSVTTIDNQAFADCSNLTSINYLGSKKEWNSIRVSYSWDHNTGDYTVTFGRTAGLEYELNADGVSYTCVGIGTCTESDIIISYYNDLPVTRIGDSAFYDCSSLTTVTIKNSITAIGDAAFSNCFRLTSITIPDGVTTIGDKAFYFCFGLTTITIPDSVITIGDEAFSNCSRLTTITIPDGVTTIGDKVFYYCSSLTSITIPDGVTTIGDKAFYYCSSLTSITIPDGVTTIGDKVFNYCSSLTSITIPDGVTTIGDFAFYYCSSLTNIKYQGSKEEWDSITKGSSWDSDAGSYTITYNYDGE